MKTPVTVSEVAGVTINKIFSLEKILLKMKCILAVRRLNQQINLQTALLDI